MRRLLEIYRYVSGAAFLLSAGILIVPAVVALIPGYSVEGPSTLFGMIGLLGLVMSFLCFGITVIGIAIFDQVRDATSHLASLREEVEWLRSELRDRAS